MVSRMLRLLSQLAQHHAYSCGNGSLLDASGKFKFAILINFDSRIQTRVNEIYRRIKVQFSSANISLLCVFDSIFIQFSLRGIFITIL